MEEKAKLEARKKEIDAQIANLPSNIVRGRQRLIGAFKAEADRINLRLEQLDAELPKMQVQQITINTHAGPIVYVSQAFHVSVEQAVKYVISIIIFVFDPLAIALLVAGNFLWEKRAQALRVSAEPSVQSYKAREPLQKTLDDGAEAVPGTTPIESADAVGVPIPKEEAREDSAAIHAEVGPPPVHVATSEELGEQPRFQPSKPIGSAKVDVGLADIKMVETTTTADERVPRTRNPEQAIREAAFYIAEKREFKDGTPADDWVHAEKEHKKDRRTVG